jgi:hypothetical protein
LALVQSIGTPARMGTINLSRRCASQITRCNLLHSKPAILLFSPLNSECNGIILLVRAFSYLHYRRWYPVRQYFSSHQSMCESCTCENDISFLHVPTFQAASRELGNCQERTTSDASLVHHSVLCGASHVVVLITRIATPFLV